MTGLRSTISELLTGEPKAHQLPPPPPFAGRPPMHHPNPPPPRMMHHPTPPPPPPYPRQTLPQIPWLLISSTDIRSSAAPAPLFAITRSRASGHLSRKSLIAITRLATGAPIGTIVFASSGSLGVVEYIELTTANDGGSATHRMKEDGNFHFRWRYRPVVGAGVTWYWSEADDGGGGLKMTEGAKDGRVLATLRGGTLVCESGVGFTEAAVDEIVVTAVAMLEKRKELGEQAEAAQGAADVISALSGGGGS